MKQTQCAKGKTISLPNLQLGMGLITNSNLPSCEWKNIRVPVHNIVLYNAAASLAGNPG